MNLSALKIVEKLSKHGFVAYWAGGCVRDILLGKEPSDYDIVTSATPEQVEAVLPNTVPIGKHFGVILAKQGDSQFEIATFRADSKSSDGRRPDFVEFKSEQEDAKRRDFTINGLFYNPLTDEIIDYIEGKQDLEAKLIRFIGDPETRIQEDYLRILRAVRFKNTLGFQYHPATYQAIKKNKHLVSKISVERVQMELNKMLLSSNRTKALNDLEDLGILEILLPEVQAMKGVAQPAEFHHGNDVYTHSVNALDTLPSNAPLSLIWATLLHDSGKVTTFKLSGDRIKFEGHAEASAVIATTILKRLNFSRKFTEKVSWMCKYHMNLFQILQMPKSAKIKWFLHPHFLDLLELHKADASGINPSDTGVYQLILDEYRYEMSLRPQDLPELLSGKEIMQVLKIPAGPKIKDYKERIRELQYEGKLKTKENALQWIAKFRSHE